MLRDRGLKNSLSNIYSTQLISLKQHQISKNKKTVKLSYLGISFFLQYQTPQISALGSVSATIIARPSVRPSRFTTNTNHSFFRCKKKNTVVTVLPETTIHSPRRNSSPWIRADRSSAGEYVYCQSLTAAATTVCHHHLHHHTGPGCSGRRPLSNEFCVYHFV